MYIKQIVNDRLRLRNIAFWMGKSNSPILLCRAKKLQMFVKVEYFFFGFVDHAVLNICT